MPEFRLQRVENLIREEISSMIMKGVVKDPRVSSLCSINKVEVAKDLSFAKVFVTGFESEKKVQSCVEALNHAAGFIQGTLGKKMKTRTTPKLKFIADTSIRDGFSMVKKLESLEISEPEPDETGDDQEEI